ncbi:MAG: TatD family hydrolase, partial [Deltaproteobacteria bacterium]|nr:TatD family hydrolase [Deltaproteobacteria bacterium]
MRIIDPHLHTDRMKGKDLETLSIAGVEAAILPTPHLLPWIVSAETMFRMWDNFLEFQVKHQKSLGIDVKVTLGVPFYGLEHEAVEECLKRLPEYLKHENAVGLGEIGMDAGLEAEERLFRAHLNLAKEN